MPSSTININAMQHIQPQANLHPINSNNNINYNARPTVLRPVGSPTIEIINTALRPVSSTNNFSPDVAIMSMAGDKISTAATQLLVQTTSTSAPTTVSNLKDRLSSHSFL